MFIDGVDHDEIAAERNQWVREQLEEAEAEGLHDERACAESNGDCACMA